MLLPVYGGTLIKKENKWFVTFTRTINTPTLFPEEKVVEEELQVFPDEKYPLESLEANVDKIVDFTVAKKFLAKETLWYAKINVTPKKETWDDLVAKFKSEVKWSSDVNVMFIEWLKETYKVPKKK